MEGSPLLRQLREHQPGLFHVVAGTMLSPHRQSVLTNACVKAFVDPATRAPGTIYEPKGRVRLLGLLSESNPSHQEDYLDAGDGMLICMKRTKKMAPSSTKKGYCEPKTKVPNVSDASDNETEPDSNRQLVCTTPEPSHASTDLAPLLEPTRQPRLGSFPFNWMWESVSVKGQAMYQDSSLAKTKKKNPPRVSDLSIHQPPATPEPSLAPTGGKDNSCLEICKPLTGTDNSRLRSRHQKCCQCGGLPPGSPLVPLYWKMEARADARKRQLRQERRHWLQLTQQLLSLEEHPPRKEKRLSVKQLEEKLRAELLCLATEPEEPSPQKENKKGKGQDPATKEEMTFKPTINRKIPNFKNLQKRFQDQLARKKEKAKLTICKPFHLHSTNSSQTLSGNEDKQVEEDPFYEVQQLWGVQWRAHSCPDFSPPVMHTKASDKRQEANRLLILEWERRERQEKRRAELRRAKQQQVQRDVAKCLATYRTQGRSPMSIQRRREELRRQEKQRMEEYTLQLQEIQERVDSRPYLFERVMQTNARQAVERRFSQVLSALGINEEMLWKNATRPLTARSTSKAMHKRTESLEDLPEHFPTSSEDLGEQKVGRQKTMR
ncbi:testis-specific protein 10-interacting protein [Sceloporus undulatus]|uniref:testis-specific protein 10-interacting protein n=1 Tax=Sceloporus undulatus TaxID=8520 RepID=UPI001C4A8D46|nr:testis-specific protein 10-interacting protein [Sceloporus undulatus]